ncbi:MAG: hypothetical protein RIS64_4087 [Bacteroidota bacterium]|jgi:hypothetical protein
MTTLPQQHSFKKITTMMYRNLILFSLFCTLRPFSSQAQRFEAGVHVGLNNFIGDLTDRFNSVNIGFGGHFTYNPHHKIAVRMDLMNQFFSGDDKLSHSTYRQGRGFSFSYSMQEISLMSELRPFDRNQFNGTTGNGFQKTFSPYGFGGVGMLFRVSGKTQAPTEVLPAPFPEVGDTKTSFPFLIMGGGLRWHLAPRYKLSGEMSGRYYFSDYIDGVSSNANPRSKDMAFFGNLTLSYILDVPIAMRKRSLFLL